MTPRRHTCRSVRNLIPLHVGGDLDTDEAAVVDEHLHACLTCFREFREYATMRGRLGVLAEEPLPAGALDGFAEEVMARVAVGEPGPRAELPGRPGLLQRLPRYAAAAALLLVVGVGSHQLALQQGWIGPVTPPQNGSPSTGTPFVADGSDLDPRSLPENSSPTPREEMLESMHGNRPSMTVGDGDNAMPLLRLHDDAGKIPGTGLVVDPTRTLRPRRLLDDR